MTTPRNKLACSVIALATLSVATAFAQNDQVDPIRVLYITGGGYHDYQGQQRLLAEGLSARANIDWTVDFEAGNNNGHTFTRFSDPDWHEKFDAVIYNMCNADVTDVNYIEGFTRGHYESGTAAIVTHCAMHSFRDAETEEWNRLIGLRTYHHERQQREIHIENLHSGHPIMAGFPGNQWLSPRDELYIVQDSYENLVPLAMAYGEETGRHHVVMWANRYGKARVVGTSAGHNNEVIAHPVFLDFISRGLLWSVNKIDENGEPLPGYEGTGDYSDFEDENYQPDPSAKLAGDPIGTEGAWGNSNATKHRALDGDTSTFFDGPEADGVWVGLDLGEPAPITAVRFAPRQGHEDRLRGGKLQGANEADFSDAVDLHTIQWATGGIAGRRLENTESFRYVRFLSPDGGFGNASLIEFYSE